jgi:hypothetical protein
MMDAAPLATPPGPAVPPPWSSLHPPGTCWKEAGLYVLQSTAENTVRRLSNTAPAIEIWYRPLAGGTNVYHTPRENEVWQSPLGPSFTVVAFTFVPTTGTLTVNACAPEHRSFAGADN